MTIFDFAMVAVSLILGLAISYLLESIVDVFRARRRCRMDWIPFVWTGCVLVQQLQFWWALYDLNTILSLSVGVFSLLLCLAGLLFLAGALVLPSGEAEYPDDLWVYFNTDGSWAAAALALFNFMAIGANTLLFGGQITNTVNILVFVLVLISSLVAVTRKRAWQMGLTAGYVIVLVFTEIVATRAVYINTGG